MRTGMEWDEWYHELCTVVAKKSQCHSRKIGAVLVKDKTVISTGYNGPPRGLMPCDERWLYDHEMQKVAGFDKLPPLEFKNKYKHELEGMCPRYVHEMGFKSGEGLEWCVAGHAERNALINAARNGIQTKGSKLYMDCGIPCTPCLVEIINAGVEEIIVTKIAYYDISSEYVLKNSFATKGGAHHKTNLKYRVYDHLKGE